MTTTKPDPAAIGGTTAPGEPHTPAREHVKGCTLKPTHLGHCQTGSSFLDEAKPSKLEETVEAEDLRARLIAQGVQVGEDASLEGLRELWATFGGGDPRAEELAAEIERTRQNEETTEPEREIEEPAESETSPLDPERQEQAESALEDAIAILAEPGEDDDEDTVADAAARAQQAAGTAKTDPGTTSLFDIDDYNDPELALPAIDGHTIDRIAVQFSGEVMLDRGNKDHVALWKRLKLGRSVELWVEAKGQGFQGKGATNRDGDLDVIVGKRNVSIQTVRILNPEELQDAAREIAAQARDAAETEAAAEQASILEEAAS